jgi:hypothetical protein
MDTEARVEESHHELSESSATGGYAPRHIALCSVVAVVDYLGALYVLTEIAHLSHASGLLLALVWLVPVFGVLWLVGAFEEADGSHRAGRWPYARREPDVEVHGPQSQVHERGAYVGSASTRDGRADSAA